MIEYWSQSRVNMLARCPRQFYYRYILGLKIPPNAALTFGTTYHKTLEANFKYKIEDGQDLSGAIATDIFLDEWNRRSTDLEWGREEQNPGWYKDMGVGLVRVYVKQVAPIRLPVAVEVEAEASIAGVDKPLIGTIDFIGQGNYILEHKTAGRRWSQSRADNSLQVTAYYLLHKGVYGKVPPTKFIYDIALKNKKLQIQTLETARSYGDLVDFEGRVLIAQDLVDKEVFPKTSPDNWYCSPRWCGYYQNCMGGVPVSQLRLVEEDNLSNAI